MAFAQKKRGTMRVTRPSDNQAGGKDSPKNDTTKIRTQLHPQKKHTWHKGHPKSIKFRRSRRLQYCITQVCYLCYHRSSHHKDRESNQINLRSRSKQEDSPKKTGRQINKTQLKGKKESSEKVLNEIEVRQPSDTEFKTVVIRKLNELSENYQKLEGSYKELIANNNSKKKDIEAIINSKEEMK